MKKYIIKSTLNLIKYDLSEVFETLTPQICQSIFAGVSNCVST